MVRKISARIQDLLRSPDSAELDGIFPARLMHTLILWLMGGAIIIAIGLYIYLEVNLRTTVLALVLAFIGCMGFLLWIIRRDYNLRAGVALSILLVIFVHIPVITTGGADSPFISGYPVAVVVAGLLVGRRAAAIVGGLSLASFWYVLATPSAAALDIPSVSPIAKVIVYGVVMVLLILCLRLARSTQMEARRNMLMSEKESRTVADKYRLLVENLPVVAHVAEPGVHGAWLYISPQVEAMFGFTAQEWTQNPELWAEQLHPEDRQRIIAEEKRLSTVVSGKATDWEYRFIHRDGRVVWLQDNCILTWDENLDKYLWHGIFVDISARKQAEEETQRLSRELLLLDSVRSVLAREVELPALLHTVVESIAAYHGYSLASIYLLEDEELVLQHQVGYDNVIERIPISMGLSGQVARTGQPVYVEDVSAAPDFLGAIEGIVSEISVPLFDQGRVAGTLNVESINGNKLTAEDLKLMLALGEHVSVALGRARLYGDLQRKNRIESALQKSTLAIIGEMELSEALQAILAQAASLMGTANAFIYLTSPAEDELILALGTGIYEQILGVKLKRGEGMAGKIWETAQPLNITDYHAWAGRSPIFDETTFHAVLGVPLISGTRMTGVLGLAQLEPERTFNDEDMELLTRFAQLASIALENARLFTLGQQELFERKMAESLQSAVYRISEAAHKTSSLDELYKSVHAIIGEVMPADNFYIALYDAAQELLSFPYFVDELDASVPEGPTRSGRGLSEYVIRTGQVLLCDSSKFEELVGNGEVVEVGPASSIWLGAPLIVEGRTIGVIALQDYANPLAYGVRELQMLEFVSAQVAKAIERKQAEENLKNTLSLLNATLESTADGILVVNAQGKIASFNQRFVSMWQIPESIIATRDDNQALAFVLDQLKDPDGFLNKVEQLYLQLEAESFDVLEFKDARVFERYSHPQRVDGKNVGRVWSFRDISARKQRERELLALASVSAALRTASTRAEIMPIVLDQVLALFNARGASLILHDRFTGEGRIEAARGVWEYSLGLTIPAGKGTTGNVMSTGRSYVTANATEDPLIYYKHDFEKIPAFACVPLSTPTGLLGTINVGRAEPFTPEDVRVLENVADIAANAIQRIASHELAVHRVNQLQALHNIDIAITSSLDLRVTLNVLLDHTIAQLDVDAACILKMSDSLHKLSFAAGCGFETAESELGVFDCNTSFAGRVAARRQSIIITEIRQETMPTWFSAFLNTEKFVSYIGVPLVAKGTLVGILEVFHRSPIRASSEWVEFLETLATQAALAMDNAELFTNLQQSNLSLAFSYDATIEGWSRALDLRDKETEGHTQRVTEQTLRLARIMQISEEQIAHIRRGALLHDIGKMGVPDSILLKPAPLTEAEWSVMRRHPQYAYDLISPIRYLEPAIDIPFCHHEKWDGSGYPRGLAGERIPLAARIFTVVDVWDALTSNRPYREAWPEEKVLAYIREHSGTHFDPKVVEVFLKTRQKFS